MVRATSSIRDATRPAHSGELTCGDRFGFGENWARFLSELTESRILTAERSLQDMLGVSDLADHRLLDIGCGSGLFSLAARRLGACVHSFDFDPRSVACCLVLKERFFPGDASWVVQEGSVLDAAFLESLGEVDVVYAWGVLHHTGALWQALGNVIPCVSAGGKLFIAIYNDQGGVSRRWRSIKRIYNRLPPQARFLLEWPAVAHFWWRPSIKDLLRGRPGHSWRTYRQKRGMSPRRDVVDWVGGYPFEVAKPEQIFDFYRDRGFALLRLKTCGGHLGCNEFVFEKETAARRRPLDRDPAATTTNATQAA